MGGCSRRGEGQQLGGSGEGAHIPPEGGEGWGLEGLVWVAVGWG